MTTEESQQLIIDYQQTFGSEMGQRVLADLKRLSKLNSSFVPIDNEGRIDPLQLMRNEGQRSVLVHIYTKLGKDPFETKQERAINE